MRAFDMGEYATVVGWVDLDYKKYRADLGVESIESILEKEYDYIIIAHANEKVVQEIKCNLIGMGIKSEKIIWKKVRIKNCESI